MRRFACHVERSLTLHFEVSLHVNGTFRSVHGIVFKTVCGAFHHLHLDALTTKDVEGWERVAAGEAHAFEVHGELIVAVDCE